MAYTQTFPNGQTLNSSALTDDEITSIMQQATCSCFGLSNNLTFSCNLVQNQNTVVLQGIDGIEIGYLVTDATNLLPAKTTVTAIANNVVTLSNAPTASLANTTIFVSNPIAGRLVRKAWPSDGAPAWKQGDDVAFVRCTEIDDWYNKVRDQGAEPNDAVSGLLVTEYTRVWRVFWEVRGPNSYTRASLLKSAMQLDFIHDSLAASNLYLRPDVSNPTRAPELEDGRWWNRTDLEMVFYEQVNESIVTSTVASIEVKVYNDAGLQLDLEVTE